MSFINYIRVAAYVRHWLANVYTRLFRINPLLRESKILGRKLTDSKRVKAAKESAEYYDRPEIDTSNWDASKRVMEVRIEADEQLTVLALCLHAVRRAVKYELRDRNLSIFLQHFGYQHEPEQTDACKALSTLETRLKKRYKKWDKVQQIIRNVKIRVLVCHAIFKISEKSRLEVGSLIVGGLVVLGAVHMYFYYQAATGQVVHTYWTLDDIVIQGITTAWVAVGVLILFEVFLRILLKLYERGDEVHGKNVLGNEVYRGNCLKYILRHPLQVVSLFAIVLVLGYSGLGYVRGKGTFEYFVNAASPSSGSSQEFEMAIMVDKTTLAQVHLVGTTSRTAIFLQQVPKRRENYQGEDDQQAEMPNDDRVFVPPTTYWGIVEELGTGLIDLLVPDFIQNPVNGVLRQFFPLFLSTSGSSSLSSNGQNAPYQVLVVDRQQVLCHTKGLACKSLLAKSTQDNQVSEASFRPAVLDWIPEDYYFARFPVTFSKARLDENQLAERDEEVSLLPFVDGVSYIAEDNGQVIRKLIRSLLPCTDSTSDNPVVLKVEGYSSSAPFTYNGNMELSSSVSDALNVRVANERRSNVESEIQREIENIGGLGIVVELGDDYDNLEQMQYDREFNDRPIGNARLDDDFYQDLFTRSAHIMLTDLGNCMVR